MARESLLLAVLTVVLNGAAQLMLRGAALRGASPDSPLQLAKSPLFLAAIASYGLSVLTWLAVLKRLPLTVAMPFVALVYVLVPVAAKFVFDDVLTWRMGLGMALVAMGVVIVAYR
jgi:undecaprenyl phosphate-alpha-L-ara4N flippase subunit ArnE